jgi:hypothetical protein
MYSYICINTNIDMCIHVCIYIRIHIYEYIHIHVYVYIYVCIYIYVYVIIRNLCKRIHSLIPDSEKLYLIQCVHYTGKAERGKHIDNQINGGNIIVGCSFGPHDRYIELSGMIHAFIQQMKLILKMTVDTRI